MSRHRPKLVFVTLLIMFVIGLHASTSANEPPADWFDHDFGVNSIVVHLLEGDETTLLMDGILKFAYPDGFELHYLSRTGPVTITSEAGFVQVQIGNDVQYGYEWYWLFADLRRYLFGLAEYSRIPLRFSGIDEVAERSARRYLARNDSKLVLWFDAESGLPLLIRQDEQTLITVTAYTLENDELISIDLELLFGPEPARITLDYGENGWAPTHLVLEEVGGEIQMELSHWSFPSEWKDNPLPRLAALSELNSRFRSKFDGKDYQEALAISQEMLTLAPQFWQVYLYKAFAYEGMDNFLGVVENYQQVLMRQPNNHLALNNLAYHYFLREVQISQALEMAERAVALERQDIYLDTLGYGYYLVGRYEEAKELLLEALETAPEEAVPEITEHLELVLRALGESD